MGNVQDKVGFFNDMAKLAGVPPPKPVVMKVYEHVADMREQHLPIYKNYYYKIIDDENFQFCYNTRCWP